MTPSPTFDRTVIMTRAWVIFRQTYNYPAVPFVSIGRRCFAGALRCAWTEAKEAARKAALPAPAKADRIAEINRRLDLLPFRSNYREAVSVRASLLAELNQLGA